MWDFAKKTFAFGLGAAMLTGDKLRQFVDEAVERGEMSKDEGKKFVEEVRQRGEEERRKIQARIREQVRKMLREAGCVDASRVEALEKKVEALERKLKAVEAAKSAEGPG